MKRPDRKQNHSSKNRLTLNTLLQGVWSYLLHRYTGSEDAAFGVIVSGRPDELPGIEKVGLYINTLPLHSRLELNNNAVSINWLQGHSKQALNLQNFNTHLYRKYRILQV
ncbi:MAG: condensation domain-containing protein [Ignavibacteria bacterium]